MTPYSQLYNTSAMPIILSLDNRTMLVHTKKNCIPIGRLKMQNMQFYTNWQTQKRKIYDLYQLVDQKTQKQNFIPIGFFCNLAVLSSYDTNFLNTRGYTSPIRACWFSSWSKLPIYHACV